MTYDEFLEKYKPIKNRLDLSAGFDGYAFETYGEEQDFVFAQDKNKVWTILENDSDEIPFILSNGLHFINKFSYFVTENPWEDDDDFNILID